MPICPGCGARLAPAEGPACLSHGPMPAEIADATLTVLEAADGPLSIKAVQERLAAIGVEAKVPSLSSILARDKRFCWARKGRYGLFRHGLVPGVRSLEDLVLVALVAVGGRYPSFDLAEVIESAGYGEADSVLLAIRRADPERMSEVLGRVSVPDLAMARRDVDHLMLDGSREWSSQQVLRMILDFPPYLTWPVDDVLKEWRRRMRPKRPAKRSFDATQVARPPR